MKVELTHIFENDKETLGQLVVSDNGKVLFICSTLELPYLNNIARKSRIDTGIYDCVKVGESANIKYDHIWIKNVAGRSGIKIHIVNYVRQLAGCIGVGEKYMDIDKDGEIDITNSKNTLNQLRAILPDEFKLIIK